MDIIEKNVFDSIELNALEIEKNNPCTISIVKLY